MTSVTTHFKKLTTGNNVFIVSVIVQSNCYILQFFNQMFNVSSLLLDDALKPATPLTNGAISGVAGLSVSSSGGIFKQVQQPIRQHRLPCRQLAHGTKWPLS